MNQLISLVPSVGDKDQKTSDHWLKDYPDYIPYAPDPYSLLARSYQNPDWLATF